MGQGNVGDGLDFCRLQYPQIGLPLVEPKKWIVVGADVLRRPELPSNGAVEHPTECDTIERSRMDAEPNDAARILIHDLLMGFEHPVHTENRTWREIIVRASTIRTSICRKGGCRVLLLLVLVNVNDLHEESVERAT